MYVPVFLGNICSPQRLMLSSSLPLTYKKNIIPLNKRELIYKYSERRDGDE